MQASHTYSSMASGSEIARPAHSGSKTSLANLEVLLQVVEMAIVGIYGDERFSEFATLAAGTKRVRADFDSDTNEATAKRARLDGNNYGSIVSAEIESAKGAEEGPAPALSVEAITTGTSIGHSC